ncbi:sperm-associated antigen 1-like [Saccostrea echinata]|uniref:sperm-associated antigen 1-like n=1 Tax=Saccostrea echinata TaxID=191078 RepID=UPI002A84018B|nr:sperm-associated antigen 1-like [Saccostrea echinata]
MSAQDNPLLNMGTTKKYDIPVAHLDYKYIDECNDVKYLEKILKVLRSGSEGRYPEMEKQCEDKIEKLNPASRILRKDNPVKKISDIDRDEGHSLQKDLQNWTSDIKEMEGSVNGVSEFDNENLPPIRSGAISMSGKPIQPEKDKDKKKPAMPRSYKEWDKFDVDKELEAAEKDKPREKGKSSAQPVIEDIIDSTGMSEREKEMKANREKDKGNEAFRSGDYQEAISYYSRSISLLPTPPSYNNRALAYLKTKEWLKAETDCDKVLSWEPKNIKALLRRGSARMGKKCFTEAMTDFKYVLELEPKNKRAQELIEDLKKAEVKVEEEKKQRKEKGRRMVIEEVEEDEESADEEIVIEEVSVDVESADEEIVIEEEKSFEKKKESVSVKSQEINKNKSSSVSNKKEEKPLVNGFHESSNQKSDKKDIWEEEEVPFKDSQDFMTLKTKPEVVENTSESESTQAVPSQNSIQQSESSGPTPPEIENSENENIANASLEGTRIEKEPESSGAVVAKPPEEVALVRPVFIQHPLPGPIAKLREEGNQLFREGQYGDAIQKYTEALKRLQKEKTDQIVNKSLIHSNRAACYLKTGDCATAVKDCTSSLELVPHSIKPLLRRGNAFELLENFRKAYIDYKHVLNIDSSIDIAHQGSSRCHSHLKSVDGPQWREKLPKIPSVLPWEIPDIRTPEGASSAPPTLSSVSSSSQKSSSSSSQPSSATSSSSSGNKIPSDSPTKLVKEESFDEIKSRGNEHVKNSKFKPAIECYTRCIELDPKQTVSYTNRALCYIRINEPEKAELDCTTALSLEEDNVKALFRRAQAKKMLKKFKDSLSDLVHLLRVDNKNTAAKRELELVKDYWREELKSRPPQSSSSDSNEDEAKPSKEDKTSKVKGQSSINQKSSQSQTSSKSSLPKAKHQEASKSEEKPEPKKGKQKTRKRMVIEEVDSEEKQEEKKQETPKETQKASNQPNVKQTTHSQESGAKSKHTGSSPSQQPGAKSKQADPPSHQEPKSKKKGKKNKSTVEQTSSQRSSEPSSATSEKSSTSQNSSSNPVSPSKASQKSSIKPTSTGLPVVPPAAPKLEKATPYEFIQAWNSLKNVTDTQPYADLLRQIPPKDLPQVISNKLDGSMLNKITKCVAEKFLTQGDLDLSYNVLHHLTKVPRFSTIAMFLSPAEKKDIQTVISNLQKSPSGLFGNKELSSLKKEYGL